MYYWFPFRFCIHSNFDWDAPTTHFECNWCVWLVEWCNSLPVSHVRLDTSHKCIQSSSDKFVGVNWCNYWAFMRRWKTTCVWSRDFRCDLMLRNASKLLLDQLEERILLDQSKMLRNIRSSNRTVAIDRRHNLHLKIDIQPVISILIL